jgi:hypothetical protein
VGHTNHQLFGFLFTQVLDQERHLWNQRIAAFQRKAFLTNVLGVQIPLHAFGVGQLFEHGFFVVIIERKLTSWFFQFLLQPFPLFDVGNMHVFSTDVLTVDALQQIDDVAEFEFIWRDQRSGVE